MWEDLYHVVSRFIMHFQQTQCGIKRRMDVQINRLE